LSVAQGNVLFGRFEPLIVLAGVIELRPSPEKVDTKTSEIVYT
jgi:hypothetical protein